MYKKIFLMLIFTLLIAVNNNSNNQSATIKQVQEAVKATQTAMPINDMYNVRNKVIQSQNQYQKAREAQAKQVQSYQDLIK